MVFGIVILVVFIIVFIFYMIYFKDYKKVMANFNTLVKVLDARDLLLMRILPEVKEKKIKSETTRLVDQINNNKKMGCNALIKSDVELNKYLPKVYEEINKIKNPVVKEEFKRIVNLEKSLKLIRREYNKAVDDYNENFIKHKKMCIKYLRMKPLDTYTLPEKPAESD